MDFLSSLLDSISFLSDDSSKQGESNRYANFRPSQIVCQNGNVGHPLMVSEIMVNIISYLQVHEYANFCCVCSTWQKTNTSEYVWKILSDNSNCCVDPRCDSIREGVFHNGIMEIEEIIKKTINQNLFSSFSRN